MADIFIDKRHFVNGRKSVLHLDNYFNLTEYISDRLYLLSVTCAQNGLNIQTALSSNGTQLNCVELGGSLTKNTSITGNGYSFVMSGNNTITFDSSIGLDLISPAISISADTAFYLQTPNVINTTATVGQVLTLTNATTGLCEWSSNAASADNGLSVVSGDVYLGGTLVQNTVVDGDTTTYSLSFNNLLSLGSTGIDCNYTFSNSILLSSPNIVTVDADTELRIQTPSLGTSTNGDVLSLVNNLTGESEWTTLPAFVTDNIYIADGSLTGNRILTGSSNSLTFQTLSGFTLSNAGSVLIDSSTSFNITNTTSSLIQVTGDAIIRPTTSLQLDTPLRALGTNDLSVLTLKNNLTGEAEWVNVDTIIPSSFDTNIYKNDGSLTANRVVTGATFDLTFTGVGTLGVTSNTLFDINSTTLDIDSTTVTIDATNITTTGVTTVTSTSPTTTIEGTTELRIKTAALASATNGESLLLVDKTTGEVEYGSPTVSSASVTRYSDTFVVADWTSNNLSYTAATHGRGTDPIVQAYEEVSAGVYVQVHGGVALPGGAGNMLSIQINSVGDVLISTVLAGDVFDGKIIIM